MAKTLPLADSLRGQIFRRFVDLLKFDPALDGLGISWRAWEGNADDDAPPTNDQLPWVRLSPRGGRQRWSATGELEIPLTVFVETITDSYEVEDNLNLWEAIEDVVISSTFQDAMVAAGACEVTPTEAACGHAPHLPSWAPVVPGAIYASGEIEILIRREA